MGTRPVQKVVHGTRELCLGKCGRFWKFLSNFYQFLFYTEKYPQNWEVVVECQSNSVQSLEKVPDKPKTALQPKSAWQTKSVWQTKSAWQTKGAWHTKSAWRDIPKVRDKPKVPGNPVPRVHLMCRPDGDNWYDTLFSWWWVVML